MAYRIPSLILLAGGTLILTAATANASPPVMARTLPSAPAFNATRMRMPGSNPASWSPYPINNRVMPGSDPRTWSPYPWNNGMPGSDPRTWSPYPLNNGVMPGSDPRTWSSPLYLVSHHARSVLVAEPNRQTMPALCCSYTTRTPVASAFHNLRDAGESMTAPTAAEWLQPLQ